MSVDLGGYHLFDDGDSSDDEENENGDGGMSAPTNKTKKMHNKKISVDLRGFDLFDDSDSEEDESEASDGPGKVKVKPNRENISKAANDNYKKAVTP